MKVSRHPDKHVLPAQTLQADLLHELQITFMNQTTAYIDLSRYTGIGRKGVCS